MKVYLEEDEVWPHLYESDTGAYGREFEVAADLVIEWREVGKRYWDLHHRMLEATTRKYDR